MRLRKRDYDLSVTDPGSSAAKLKGRSAALGGRAAHARLDHAGLLFAAYFEYLRVQLERGLP
jgi:hypothetical protein